MSFILDASLTLAWCFHDEATEYTNSVLAKFHETRAVVPPIWFYEITNGLIHGVRRGRLTEAASAKFIKLIATLPIEMRPAPRVDLNSFDLLKVAAQSQNLSAYDAAYLQLALDLDLPIATLDGRGKRQGLKQAAERCKVKLYQI